MLIDLINNSLYGEIILLFIIIAYLFVRWSGKKMQKREGWHNFEYFVYTELVYYYKFEGYPYPELRAKEELQNIIKRKKEECKTNTI